MAALELFFEVGLAGIRAPRASHRLRRFNGVDRGIPGLVHHLPPPEAARTGAAGGIPAERGRRRHRVATGAAAILAVTPSYGFAVLQYPNAQRRALCTGSR